MPLPQIPTRYDCVICVMAKPRADCDCARSADPRRRATVGAVRGPAARAEALLLLLTGAWMTTVTVWEAEAATAVAAGLAGPAGLGERAADALAEPAARVADGVADALAEPAARVTDGLAGEVADASRCLAGDCWLLLARAMEVIADAGVCSMVAKP